MKNVFNYTELTEKTMQIHKHQLYHSFLYTQIVSNQLNTTVIHRIKTHRKIMNLNIYYNILVEYISKSPNVIAKVDIILDF